MDWKTIRRIGQPLAWLVSLGGGVWTLVSWIWGGGLKVLENLGTPEYAALAAVFAAVLAYSSWNLCQPLRPSSRFQEMDDLIDRARLAFLSDVDRRNANEIRMESSTRAVVREMAHRLDDLKIPYPPMAGGISDVRLGHWQEFFPKLLAASRAGKLKHGRTIWLDMQKASSGRDGS